MAALEDAMWWYRALHERFLELLEQLRMGEDARLLDAGCGTGGLLRRIREAMPKVGRVGVEYDLQAALAAARKSGSALVNGTVNSLPIASKSLDAIVSADVLCQRGVSENACLDEFYRCLKPGGSVVLSVPAYGWMRSRHDEHVHAVRRYTRRSLRRLAQARGFRIVAAGYWNSVLFPLMATHRMTLGRASSRSDVRAYPALVDHAFYAATRVERALTRAGVPLPFGGSVWMWAQKP
jgi:SAM-dependent methyltransferase